MIIFLGLLVWWPLAILVLVVVVPAIAVSAIAVAPIAVSTWLLARRVRTHRAVHRGSRSGSA